MVVFMLCRLLAVGEVAVERRAADAQRAGHSGLRLAGGDHRSGLAELLVAERGFAARPAAACDRGLHAGDRAFADPRNRSLSSGGSVVRELD